MVLGTGQRKERNAIALLERKHQKLVSRLLMRNAPAKEILDALSEAGLSADQMPGMSSVYAYRKGRTHRQWVQKLDEADEFDRKAQGRALLWESLQANGAVAGLSQIAAYELFGMILDEASSVPGVDDTRPRDERVANLSLATARLMKALGGTGSDDASGSGTVQRAVFTPLAIPENVGKHETEVTP